MQLIKRHMNNDSRKKNSPDCSVLNRTNMSKTKGFCLENDLYPDISWQISLLIEVKPNRKRMLANHNSEDNSSGFFIIASGKRGPSRTLEETHKFEENHLNSIHFATYSTPFGLWFYKALKGKERKAENS